ncbi:MAG TPA: Asp-tRNA(Asn)/Glu-tRNA(Gln) amidotransferase subunit GatC [bacterium]|jgi:aspartyl-tRNA(Asn)/glutamyl-tRNA(Gln) amidotransferase subunit C
MSIDRRTVEYVARLARLQLTEEETDRFVQQLGSILAYCATLNELATEDVEPTSQVVMVTGAERDDAVGASLPRDEVLAVAPAHDAGFFKVPPVIDTEPQP